MFFRKKGIGIMTMLILFLVSCSSRSVFKYGYNYDLALEDIMVGAKIENTKQALDSEIEMELSFGHPRNQTGPTLMENSTPGPICIYVNNHYEKDNHETDPLDYKLIESKWDYVSEIPFSNFWTDEYAFDNDFFDGKRFMHTEKFHIDSSYFVTEKRENMLSETISIHVSMTWKNNEDSTWVHGISGSVSIGYRIIGDEVNFIE